MSTKPTIWRIPVTSDGKRLEIQDYLPIPLKRDDSMVWVFKVPIAEGNSPRLLQTRASGMAAKVPFGPFTHLTLQRPVPGAPPDKDESHYRIFASGYGGDSQHVDYCVGLWIKDLEDSKVRKLVFRPEEAMPTKPQQVSVSLVLQKETPESDQPPVPKLKVVPERVSIPPGAPVVWNFAVPLDLFGDEPWYPEIEFNKTPYGPFQSLSALVEPEGSDPVKGINVRLIGSGKNDTPSGRHGYTCRVCGVAGDLAVSSGDPGVDDDGEVMAPPSGPLS